MITALCTCAFTYVMFVTLVTTVVLLMTVLLTTRGPPQPPQFGRPAKLDGPHQGDTGSPQPSATQPTLTPPALPAGPPWYQATSAGAYTGRATRGPGAHAQ